MSFKFNVTGTEASRPDSYLDGLHKAFQLNSNPKSATTPASSRFDIFMGGLKGELELMALEIESLQKDRDEFKAKAEELAKELRDFRRNSVCERCKESPRFKTSLSGSVVNPSQRALHKPRPSSRRVFNSGIQHTTRKPDPNLSKTTSTRPQRDTLPPPSSQAPTSTYPELDPEQPIQSIVFNNQVGKELDVKVAHVLSHEHVIYCVNFSQDGKYLAAGCGDGNAYIYTVQTGTLSHTLRDLLPDADRITHVGFSPDGNYLATAGWRGHIYFWKIRTKHVRNVFKGHAGIIHSIDFSPNGRYLVSTSDDNKVPLWNVRDGSAKYLTEDNPVFIDKPHYRSAVFSPDGRYIAAAHRDGVVRIWCVSTGQLMRRMKTYATWVDDIAFMPDGKGLVSGGRDKTLKYWDITSLGSTRLRAVNELHENDSGAKDLSQPENGLYPKEMTTYVLSVAVSPDGRWAVSGMESSIRIWDTRNLAMQYTLNVNADAFVETVDVSPAYFASGDDTGTITIWSYVTPRPDV